MELCVRKLINNNSFFFISFDQKPQKSYVINWVIAVEVINIENF